MPKKPQEPQDIEKRNISRKATWSSAELDMERIASLMVDLLRLSYQNRLYDPMSIMPFFSALDNLNTTLRCFVTKEKREQLDNIFKIMKDRIYTKRCRNTAGVFDTKIFDDLDMIYKDLYMIRQKAQLGIPYRKPMDLRKKLESKMGLGEVYGEDYEDW